MKLIDRLFLVIFYHSFHSSKILFFLAFWGNIEGDIFQVECHTILYIAQVQIMKVTPMVQDAISWLKCHGVLLVLTYKFLLGNDTSTKFLLFFLGSTTHYRWLLKKYAYSFGLWRSKQGTQSYRMHCVKYWFLKHKRTINVL